MEQQDLYMERRGSSSNRGSNRRDTSFAPPRKRKTRALPDYTSNQYDPLPGKRGRIRILVLFPSSDNPDVECELVIPPEGEHLGYEALSWCWGTEEKSKYIHIRKDGKMYRKSVPPNLFSALHALRRRDKTRHLWVDAVCIDQEELDEKNHQVEMMDEIYSNANSVCIWLGEATKSSQTALDFIKDEVLQLQDFDDLCNNQKATWKWRALLELMQSPWFSRRWVVQEISLARKATIYCGKDKISWDKFAIAVELFVEVETATHRLSEVMQKDPKFYHIPRLFEYVSALGASLLVDATGRLFRDYKGLRRSETHGSEHEDDFEVLQGVTPGYESDSDMSVLEAFNGFHHKAMNQSIAPQRQKDKRQPLLSLGYLVSSLSIFDTTVPHDTIYALLAIAKDTTPVAAGSESEQSSDRALHALEVFTQRKRYEVDYRLPYVDICRTFIQFCIERSLQYDRSRALDILCRPWATEEKVLEARRLSEEREDREKKRKVREQEARAKAKELGRHRTSTSTSLSTNTVANGTFHLNSADDLSPEQSSLPSYHDMPLPSWVPQLSGAPYAMYPQAGMTGIKMGRKNADPLVGLPSSHSTYMAAETKSVDMKTLRFRKRLKPDHYSMYVKGFVLDKVADVEEVSRNGSIPQEWAELGGWRGATGDPPEAFWRTLVADRGRDQKNPPVYYSRACKESFLKGGYMGGAVNTQDLINYEQNSVVAQFCRRVQAVTWNRALIKTKTSRLGLVGKNVKPGDMVCILYGCSVPVVLNRSERKSDDAFEHEMQQELVFLKSTLRSNWLRYRSRIARHKERKSADKEEYREWEDERKRQWEKDPDWPRARRWSNVRLGSETVDQWRGRSFNAWKRDKEKQWRLEKEQSWERQIEEAWRKEQEVAWFKRKNEMLDAWKGKEKEREEEWRIDTEKKWGEEREAHKTKMEAIETAWREDARSSWEKKKHREKSTWRTKNNEWKKIREAEWISDVDEEWEKERFGLLREQIVRLWRKQNHDQTKIDSLTSWRPRLVNWHEFELALKFGRKWKKWVVKEKENIRNQIQAEVHKTRELSRLEKMSKAKASGKTEGTQNEPTAISRSKPLISSVSEGIVRDTGYRLDDNNIVSNRAAYSREGESVSMWNNTSENSNTVTENSFHETTANEADPLLDEGSRSVNSKSCANMEDSTVSPADNKYKLSESEKEKYDQRIKQNWIDLVGEDGYYSYTLLGECYIHGMMDGEAMAYQNENGITSTVFEMR